MMLAATLAPLLSVQLPADVDHWLCSHARQGGEAELVVTRSLDSAGRPTFDTLMWLPDQQGTSSIRWVRLDPFASAGLPWRLETNLIVAMLRPARPARRPVWLVLRVDGRVAARRPLLPQMSDLPAYEPGSSELWAGFSADQPGMGPVPDLANATEVVVIAEEEGGETLARRTISLPGRTAIDLMIAEAVPVLAADAADYRARCRETAQSPTPPPVPGPSG